MSGAITLLATGLTPTPKRGTVTFLTHDGMPLYYELHGSGPPLLLIAGLASDSRSWLPVVAGLAENFTLIIPDNRGVGRSGRECVTGIPLMADDCAALIRHLGPERVSLLGHSMGGMVAMSCAVRYPQIVDRLLLAATAARNSARNNLLFSDWAMAREADTSRAAWFRSIFTWIFTERFFEDSTMVDGAVNWLLDDPWPQSAQSFRRQVEAISAWDLTAEPGKITAPTCIISGDRDILFPPESAAGLARLIPGASLEVIEGAAHSIHSEQPAEFIRVVSAFAR